jgi:hypothetical protein
MPMLGKTLQEFIDKRYSQNPLHVFAWILCLGCFMHFGAFTWENVWIIVPLFCINILLLINPSWWILSTIGILAYLFHVGAHFPRIDNHANYTLLILLFLPLCMGFSRTKYLSTQQLQAYFVGAAFSLYFYAGFHKLNADFFKVDVSCIHFINDRVFKVLNLNPELQLVLHKLAIWPVIIIEVLVPFGLFFRRTRPLAVSLLIVFHAYISFGGLAIFGGLAMAILLISCSGFSSFSKQQFTYIYHYAVIAIFSLICVYIMQKINVPFRVRYFIQGIIMSAAFIQLIILCYKINHNVIAKKYVLIFTLPVFIFISIWSLKTYLGLGNTGNLTMYSNLVTEKSRSNHLIIDTKNTKLVPFEEDKIYIVKLDSALIKSRGIYRLQGMYIPRIELAYRLSIADQSLTAIPATIIDNNKLLELDDIIRSPYAQATWWYKYMPFRQIQPHGPNDCRW